MKHLITNIKELIGINSNPILIGSEMKELHTIKNAYLLIEDGLIADFGEMTALSETDYDKVTDASTSHVLPAWCDSHTHIVYAGNREQEFVDRINGLTYEEIANRGGGILNSAKKLQETDEEELYRQSAVRLEEVMQMGTGAIEIKSGYGLTTEAELKMLRVIKRLKENYPVTIKATFLGAHAIPAEYGKKRDKYIDLLIEEMLPQIADQKLADYIDVFCETGYFTVDETIKLMQAGKEYGLKSKLHVNQFTAIGGIRAAVEHGALSVDHLEVLLPEDIEMLTKGATIPVALPSCSYFLSIPYTPARELIDAQLPLALATDYNPGSTPSGNMNFVVATACIKMKLTPEEAINAATINGAAAMELSQTHGSIAKGKVANFIFTKDIPSYGYLPYSFGSNHIAQVMLQGEFI
ncbi:imidazolonepropionase [Planktosalinus lacus]|uniref:Imidazolonepropionase n=1 Tax=Planktosalinus lacus TaxID=1526573 RepID=A0A8J2YBL4_9FLAO|nr:imidazolonepropionase [Planktosalinus lacus]GGD96825.1 imidazolonepropionase [Planktosalinus lacus]